jgi:hypothetical protein
MRKQKILTLTALMAVIVTCSILYSCRKDKKPDDPKISSKLQPGSGDPTAVVNHTGIVKVSNYLYFNNRSTFEATLDSLKKATESERQAWESYYAGYLSMETYYDGQDYLLQRDTFTCPTTDVPLATVLNYEGIVRIDTVAYLLDYSTNSVYEVYPVTAATIDSLKLKNEINKPSMYVFHYSMEDAIFYPDSMVIQPNRIMSDGRHIPVNDTKRGVGPRWLKKWWRKATGFGSCTDNGAPDRRYKGKYEYADNTTEGVSYRYKYKLDYNKGGLHFSLMIKVKHDRKNGTNALWADFPGAICIEPYMQGKEYCGGTIGHSGFECAPNLLLPINTKAIYPVWSGFHKLAKYRLYSFFLFREMDQPLSPPHSEGDLLCGTGCIKIEGNWP